MRFSSSVEVRSRAEATAKECWTLYLEFRSDLNPYCTQSARTCWERGFIGDPPHSWEYTLEWDFQYQLGAAANRLVQEKVCST